MMIKESFLTVDAIAQRDNIFTRMDARLKVFFTISILGAIIALPGLRLPASVMALTISAVFVIRTPFKLILARLVPPLVLGSVFLIFMLFTEGHNPLFTLNVLDISVSAYSEGLLLGLTILARITASMAIILFLSVTTPIYELGRALVWFRIPEVIVEILLLTYRYIFVLWDEGMRIREAQSLRLGYSASSPGGWKRSLRSTFTLMAMVVIRAYDRADHTFSAMHLRGYNGSLAGNRYGAWNRIDTKSFVSCFVLIALLIFVCL
ncbi:MAG TPA: cobalt ECF transporter T component CbiQ [Desulfobacteria bacterium]|nr:cobalt ECF transporter T component CbiQ [Desulfobacteria bacterium]